MRKVVIAVLSVICLVFVGIFVSQIIKSNSVESIEIVGEVQTTYFVDEKTTDVNFNDAQLKVTYKDGTVKNMDLTNKLVDVKYFDTTIAKTGVMKIIYKSQTIELKYNVINTGLYFLKTDKITALTSLNSVATTAGSADKYVGLDISGTQDKTTATKMVFFYNDGKLDYYSREDANSDWYIDAGYYDPNFNYKIKGGVILAELGKNNNVEFNVNYNDQGELNLKTITKTYIKKDAKDTEFLRAVNEETYSYSSSMRSDRKIDKVEVIPNTIFTFHVNDTYESSGNNIMLKVTYKNEILIPVAYVRFNTNMLKSNKDLNTSTEINQTYATGYYKGASFRINYKVVA